MSRIFDHLDGAPEDRFLSRVAHAMRRSPWWSDVVDEPKRRNEPAPVSGEVVQRTKI